MPSVWVKGKYIGKHVSISRKPMHTCVYMDVCATYIHILTLNTLCIGGNNDGPEAWMGVQKVLTDGGKKLDELLQA